MNAIFMTQPDEQEQITLDQLLSAREFFSLVDVVFPGQSNHLGCLFGGAARAKMDKLAFVLTSRRLPRVVTAAALNQTEFRAPGPAVHPNLLRLRGRR